MLSTGLRLHRVRRAARRRHRHDDLGPRAHAQAKKRARSSASAPRRASSSRPRVRRRRSFPLVAAARGTTSRSTSRTAWKARWWSTASRPRSPSSPQQGRTTILPIPANAKIRVRTGKTTFLVSSVPRPRRHAAPLFAASRPAFLMSLRRLRGGVRHQVMLLLVPDPGRGLERQHRSRLARGHLDPYEQLVAGRPAAARGRGQARRRQGRVGRHRHGHGPRRGQDGQEGLGSRRGPVQDEEEPGGPAARAPAGDRAGADRRYPRLHRARPRVARSPR